VRKAALYYSAQGKNLIDLGKLKTCVACPRDPVYAIPNISMLIPKITDSVKNLSAHQYSASVQAGANFAGSVIATAMPELALLAKDKRDFLLARQDFELKFQLVFQPDIIGVKGRDEW